MIGILYISDLRGCPFIERYIQELDNEAIDYRIVTWNRQHEDTTEFNKGKKVIEFNYYQDTRLGKAKKIKGFLLYRHFLIKTIKKYGFEKLVVLCTLTAFLIYPLLNGEYKGKYIFDFRDLSLEKHPWFKQMEKKIVDSSYYTAISSEGFLEVLPECDKYIFSPNLRRDDVHYALEHRIKFNKKKYGDKLNFVYIGALRYYDQMKKTIDAFANDERFELFFHGKGDDGYLEVINYIKSKGYRNITFTGAYLNSEKPKLLEEADLLNNYYGPSFGMRYANTNKYMDSCIYHIPLVSNLSNHDGKSSIRDGIGIAYTDTPNPDSLYEDYFRIIDDKFNEACSQKLDKSLEYEDKGREKFRDFLGGTNGL